MAPGTTTTVRIPKEIGAAIARIAALSRPIFRRSAHRSGKAFHLLGRGPAGGGGSSCPSDLRVVALAVCVTVKAK
jgi:hypothetical protein